MWGFYTEDTSNPAQFSGEYYVLNYYFWERFLHEQLTLLYCCRPDGTDYGGNGCEGKDIFLIYNIRTMSYHFLKLDAVET